MEELNKAVEGEQPDSNQNELKKETTDPLKNESLVVKRALKKASEILGARSTSGRSSTASSRSRSTAPGSSKQEGQKSPRSGLKSTPTKAAPTASTSKAVASGEPEEDRSMEPAIETNLVDQKGSRGGEKNGNRKSVSDQQSKGEAITSPSSGSERDSDQHQGKPEGDKELESLKRKAEKAKKKVSKLKKKYKKAKKKEVKKSKLNLLKDKIIKANTKLKRRKKKLEKANE